MPQSEAYYARGGCACRTVRFALTAPPLFVHCCHCRWCQRETGAAFALNALIETAAVEPLAGAPALVDTPSESGKGQKIARCPACQIALWSHYAGMGDKVAFIRVGALDNPDIAPPDIHIFAASKQPWVVLPAGARVCETYYRWREEWPETSRARFEALRAG